MPPANAVLNESLQSSPVSARYPHSYTEAGIMRTYNPGYANYQGDGSGRDGYILLNNGGLTKQSKMGIMWNCVANRSPRSKNVSVIGGKPTPSFKYRPDGTGRDSYVIPNQGGLVKDFRSSRAHAVLAGSLRNHEVSENAASILRHTDRSNFRTPREKAAINLRATL